MKRFFILSLTMILALSAWADDVDLAKQLIPTFSLQHSGNADTNGTVSGGSFEGNFSTNSNLGWNLKAVGNYLRITKESAFAEGDIISVVIVMKGNYSTGRGITIANAASSGTFTQDIEVPSWYKDGSSTGAVATLRYTLTAENATALGNDLYILYNSIQTWIQKVEVGSSFATAPNAVSEKTWELSKFFGNQSTGSTFANYIIFDDLFFAKSTALLNITNAAIPRFTGSASSAKEFNDKSTQNIKMNLSSGRGIVSVYSTAEPRYYLGTGSVTSFTQLTGVSETVGSDTYNAYAMAYNVDATTALAIIKNGNSSTPIYKISVTPETMINPTIEYSATNEYTVTAGTSNAGSLVTINTYYTTDGNAPTSSSTPLPNDGKIPVTDGMTQIKIISISSNGTESAIITQDVTYEGLNLTELTSENVSVEAVTYNGSEQTAVVKYNSTALTKGTDYTVTAGTDVLTDAGNTTFTIEGTGNYTGTVSDLTFTINKATYTVEGEASATAPYGTQVKNISISGLTVKDVSDNVVEGSWAFTSEETPNVDNSTAYTATFTPTTANDNYNPLTQDITPVITSGTQAATITAESTQSTTYNGQAQPLIASVDYGTLLITYYTNEGHTEGATTDAPINAGTYYAIVSQSDANYTSESVNVTYTINKATLTAKAADANRAFGEENPAFTVNVTGFVNEETAESLTTAGVYTAPTATTTANASSPAGTYNIVPSGGQATNYEFTYENGTLTVNAAAPQWSEVNEFTNLYTNKENITVTVDKFSDGVTPACENPTDADSKITYQYKGNDDNNYYGITLHGISFQLKRKTNDSKVNFVLSDYYLAIGAATKITIPGLTAGQIVTIKAKTTNTKNVVFTLTSGGETYSGNPSGGTGSTSADFKYKATGGDLVLTTSGGNPCIEKITIYDTYTITAAPEDENYGTAAVETSWIGNNKYEKTTNVEVTATGTGNYAFDHWSIEGNGNYSTDNPLTVSNLSANWALTAHYRELTTYTFSVTAGEGGTVKVYKDDDEENEWTVVSPVAEGTKLKLVAGETEGYSFKNWTSGENVVSIESVYVINSLSANTDLKANFISTSNLVPVILTAGQSNTDGRISDALPSDFTGLSHCYWSYCNAQSVPSGTFAEGNRRYTPGFELYSPKSDNGTCWGYDAVVYDLVGKALNSNFYVVKQSKGNTAISPDAGGCGVYWAADQVYRKTNSGWGYDTEWFSSNTSVNSGGLSLLKAFEDNIAASMTALQDQEKLGDIKFMLWHQGECDGGSGNTAYAYYENLKAVVNHVRNYLATNYGEKYRNLPFICGTVAKNSKEYHAYVENALYRLQKDLENFYVINMSQGTFISDGVHFNQESAVRLGKKMYNKIVERRYINGSAVEVEDIDAKIYNDNTYNFRNWAFVNSDVTTNISGTNTYKAVSLGDAVSGESDLFVINNLAMDANMQTDMKLEGRFALSSITSNGTQNDDVNVRINPNNNSSTGLHTKANATPTFSILNLSPGDAVTIVCDEDALTFKSTNAFKEGDDTKTAVTTTTQWVSNETYIITSGNRIDFTFGGTTQHYIYSVTIEPNKVEILPTQPTPPYGTYDFRKFAVENVSANTDKIKVEKDANGIMTGTFTSTAEGITVSGSMTLNDAFSATDSKAANVKMRRNGSTISSTSSGLFINKSQAALNLLKLKAGDWFTIDYEGGLTFASTNVKKQGSSSAVAEDETLTSGAVYVVQSGTEVNLKFGNSSVASYIFTVTISEDAMTPSVTFKEVTSEGKAVYTITSLDGNSIRYTLNNGAEQQPSGSTVDITLSEKTTLKAWAVNSSGTAGNAIEVELLSTPVVLSDGLFDFKNKLSSLEANVSLAVEGEPVQTITDGENSIPLYMPVIQMAATFAGQFAFSKPGTSNTALRSNQFHINTNETNKTFYMAVLNAPIGYKLMMIDGNKEVSKVYVGSKELSYGESYKIQSEDLTDGNLILKFDLTGGSAQIQSIKLTAPGATVEGDLYISPSGNDNNNGTREAPLRTLKKAHEKVESGQTIVIMTGTYKVTNAEYMDKSDKTWNVVYNLDKKNVSYIGEVDGNGKRPVFDFSGVSPEDGKRITGFLLKTSGITIKNIESIGIQIPSSSSNVQSENFRLNGASDCLIKNVAAHDGYGIGFYLTGKTNNCVIEDCDAYNNADKINNTGENNDGFGCHVNENCPGNKFVRCRAWYNADDGFDFISCYSAATVEDCIAWRNGRTDSSFSDIKGNGNGFKAGGYGMKSDETGKAHPMHEVTGSIAVDQPHGFYANHHLAGLKFTNNRAYKNSVDYLMTNRKGEGTSSSDLTDVPGYDHEITGNISYGNTDITKVVDMVDTETCTLAGNSFSYSNGEWSNKAYADADFVSLKVSDLLLDRDEDGNLPEAVFNFMKLKVPAEVIEDPTVTLKSADESKTIYNVTYPAGTELHYKLPGSSKEQQATTSESADIEVTTAGILQVWAVKGNSSSSVVKQSVLLLAPVVYDFANTTSDIKADDGTKVRVMTYKDHNDKAQRNQEFWYVTEESAKLRVLTFKEAGKYTQGTGLSLKKANRPIAIEGVKAGDFVRIFHNGGTLSDGNMPDIGTTITDASGKAITGSIESGQLIKITATAGNVDDYVMFQSTTQDFTITKVVINTALDPVVEKDDAKSTDSKWVYNVSFCEDETLHYTSPDVSGEQTVNYTGNPVTIEVSKTGKLVCWTTVGSRTSEQVTRTIDMVNAPAEVTLEPGYQTYYTEKPLDLSEVSTDVLRAYIVKATTTTAATRAATRDPSASQLELVEVTKVPAKTALILWGKKATTVEIPQAAQTTVVITQVDNTEVNTTVNLLKKAVKTESADANETFFVPNTDGELSFEYSSFVTRNGIYIEIPTSVVGEDAKEITLGEPQEDGTIIPLETAVAALKNITPTLDAENSNKSKKVYIFKFDNSLKLYYKRPGQDTEFRSQSYKEGFESSGFTVNSTYNGYLEYYVMKGKESSRTDAKEIVLAPKATRTKLEKNSATYEISFFDGATLYYTLGDDAEKTTDEGSPLELTLTKGAKITAYSKTSTETTESLSTNLYAPTPSIVNDSVYKFADIKNQIGIDYVLTSAGYEDDAVEIDGVSLKKPNALTSQTLDRFAFSAPRADGKGETSDWRLLNAGRLRAAKSEVDKHLLIQGAKKGNMLLLTFSGAKINYAESMSTAKLADGTTSITSNTKYEVKNDGDLMLKIPADESNNCDITVISLSSSYDPSSGSSSSSEEEKKNSTSLTISFNKLYKDTIAIWRFEWEKGRELHYILGEEGKEEIGGTSGLHDMYISTGVKVQAWTMLDSDSSKVVTTNLFPPTRRMLVEGNYDFAEIADELFADMPIALDMDRGVGVAHKLLYMPNQLTYKTLKDRFAFSEFPKSSTLRMRRNRSLTFAKGEDVLMGILDLKAGDIVAFDFTGTIFIQNGSLVERESSRANTRIADSSEMASGESYTVQEDGSLLLKVVPKDSAVVINKIYIGSTPGRSHSEAIDFVTAGEEFEALEFGKTSSVYINEKEKAQAFKRVTNDSQELPIDNKLSTESGNGIISTNGIAASNRRIAIHELGKGDLIKVRFPSGGVTYEGHETNGNIVSVNGRRLTPGDSLRTGDVIRVDKVNDLYNYIVLKLNSKANVTGIYINSEETEKVSMPVIVDKGKNTVQITAGQSSIGNKVTTCYTVDGSEPTRTNGTSGPYEEFDVQLLKGGIVTIKAMSYTDRGLYSRVAELTIFADDLIGGGSGSSNTRGATGTYDMQGNKVQSTRRGKLYIKDGKVVFFER